MEDYKYLVRVSCMTYNHASYIEDAMNGFCMQETSFPFVCTIVDDASTDGEQEVIKKYLQEHFDLADESVVRNEETDDYFLTFAQHKMNKSCFFAVLFLKYNHYSIKKSKRPYLEEWSNTKYVAVCEGDDYWIVSDKLQKQVEFMEVHPSCGLCYTKAKVYNETSKEFLNETIGFDCGENAFLSLLEKNVIPTLTVLYRKCVSVGYKEFVEGKSWKMGDYPMWLYLALRSEVIFLNIVTATYRCLPESASHSNDYTKRIDFLNSTLEIKLYFIEKSRMGDCVAIKNSYYHTLLSIAFSYRHYSEVMFCYKKCQNHSFKERLKYYISRLRVLLK